MKILYLCSDPGVPVLGRKGASVHVRSMVAALTRAGHEVVLAAPSLNKSPWEQPEEVAGKLLPIKWPVTAQEPVFALKEFTKLVGQGNGLHGELRRILLNKHLLTELRRRFDSHPPDFIYERGSLFATAGVSLARSFGVPLLLEVNAPLAMEQAAYRDSGLRELAAASERYVLTQADAVLAVSAPLRDHITQLGADPARVHVLPNAIDGSRFTPGSPDPELRKRLGLGSGPVLGFVGGLRPWHGVELLPELLSRLAGHYPDIRMVIAGDGQLRQDLETEMATRGLSHHVIFTGALLHDQVPAILRQLDIALAPYPALDHPFYFSPLKLFEYMACGIAVVASDCGQVSELVRDGITGLLHPAGDLSALTSACERLLKDPKLRRSIGQCGAAVVHKDFTWNRNAERVLHLATGLLSARAATTKSTSNALPDSLHP